MLADRYEARMIRGWTHAAALHELESVAGLPAGWRGARPYVGVYEPWKLRVSWTLAWLLVLAELGFFLAEWLTLTTRETAGECAQTMLVAFFVAPLSGTPRAPSRVRPHRAHVCLRAAPRGSSAEERRMPSPPPASSSSRWRRHQAQDELEQQLGDPKEPQAVKAAHHLDLQSISKPVRGASRALLAEEKGAKADSSAATDEASAELSRRVSARRVAGGGGGRGRRRRRWGAEEGEDAAAHHARGDRPRRARRGGARVRGGAKVGVGARERRGGGGGGGAAEPDGVRLRDVDGVAL